MRNKPLQTSREAKGKWPDGRHTVGALLHKDDFTDSKLPDWVVEREGGGTVNAVKGHLDVDVPKGCTIWYRHELTGPLVIEYEATVIQRGGPHDRASDLNCFWMARNPRRPGKLLEVSRSGTFSDYDSLLTYYVGLGGNGNTTTRFRRYIGRPGDRPLLPEHDLKAPEFLIKPNAPQTIRLVACGSLIQYYRDNRLLFELSDPAPYVRGWFGLRTVTSHLQIARFRVHRLIYKEK